MFSKKPKKDKFRKNVIDLAVVLPVKENTITGGGMIIKRINMDRITDIEYMSAVFREMWVTLVSKDKQLNDVFNTYFKNQAIEQKRVDKLLEKAQKKSRIEPTEAELADAKEKLENFFANKPPEEDFDGTPDGNNDEDEAKENEPVAGSALDKAGATH